MNSLKAAIDIRKSLTGVNYIKEFPVIVDYLKSLIIESAEVDISEDDEGLVLNLECDNILLRDWRIYFEENEVYACIDHTDEVIPLFNPKNIDDQKLQSLIFQDGTYAEEWITQLITQMKAKAKPLYKSSQSI